MEIKYTQTALEDLRLIPKRIAAQIVRKISRLESGLHGDIKKLQASDIGYRLRSGTYRVLFDLDGTTIVVHRIKHRKTAYD